MEKNRNMVESCWRSLNGQTYFEVPALYLLKELRTTTKILARKAGLWVGIWNSDLSNGEQQWVRSEHVTLSSYAHLYGLTKSAYLLRSIHVVYSNCNWMNTSSVATVLLASRPNVFPKKSRIYKTKISKITNFFTYCSLLTNGVMTFSIISIHVSHKPFPWSLVQILVVSNVLHTRPHRILLSSCL